MHHFLCALLCCKDIFRGSVQEMLALVDQASNFLDEFEHWQLKYQRAKPAKKLSQAGNIDLGSHFRTYWMPMIAF